MRTTRRDGYAALVALAVAACDSAEDPASTNGTGGTGGAAGSGGAAAAAGAGGSADGGGATGGTAGSDGAAGAGAPGDWSCLGKVTYPPAPAATAAVSLTYYHAPTAYDPAGVVAFADMDVAACLDADPTCASPVAQGKTNAAGTVALTLPTPGTGFTGFLMAAGGGAGKTLMLQGPPIRGQSDVLFTELIVLTPAASDALVKAAGKQPDASKGNIATVTHDCANKQAIAASVTAGNSAPTVYFQPNGDVNQQKSSNAVFLNLAPGTVKLEMKLEATGQKAASLDVPVAAGAWTFVMLAPMP